MINIKTETSGILYNHKALYTYHSILYFFYKSGVIYMDLNIKDFPDDLMKEIDTLANQKNRSRSQQIIYMLKQLIKAKPNNNVNPREALDNLDKQLKDLW